jgi:hypothetical protein
MSFSYNMKYESPDMKYQNKSSNIKYENTSPAMKYELAEYTPPQPSYPSTSRCGPVGYEEREIRYKSKKNNHNIS